MGAGQLRERLIFQRLGRTGDGMGGSAVNYVDVATVWGSFAPERGRERLEAGRLEAALGGVVRVRSSTTMRAVTEADSVMIDGVRFQIRSIANPDQRNKYLEMTVEKGGAV